MSTILLAACCSFGVRDAHGVTVALDIGHSRSKPGATSALGAPEFGFNRALGIVLRDELQTHGITVRMTGEDGEARSLVARAGAASGADLLLSIHHDSVQPQYLEDRELDGKHHRVSDRFSGFSLFVSRSNPHPAASLKCASAIGAALRGAGFKSSHHHAEKIPGENRPFADEANGVYYFDDLVVLKTARVPAVLLEAGIIVNPADELVLREGATRQRIAGAVASALRCLAKSPH